MAERRPPIAKPPEGVRFFWRKKWQTWRMVWEPSPARRRAGMSAVELDATRLTQSVRKAEELNAKARQLLGQEEDLKQPLAKGSIDVVAAQWLKSPRVQSLTAVSQKNYSYDVGRIRDKFGGQHVRNITKRKAADWYEQLYRETEPRMAQRLIATLRQVMEYAALKEHIAANPVAGLRMVTPKRRSRVLTPAELQALFAAAAELDDQPMILAMKLALFQGQRSTSVAMLQVGHLEIASIGDQAPRLVWNLARSKNQTQTRLVIHTSIVKDVQRAMMRAGDPSWHLVSDGQGLQLMAQRISERFARIRKLASKKAPSLLIGHEKAQFRDLRRTFADNARHAGIDPRVIDDALGNTAGEDPALSQTYMPASDALAAQAVDAVNFALTNEDGEGGVGG